MRIEMRPQTQRERLLEATLGMYRWVFQRQTEIAEALSFWAALNWALTLLDPGALESSPTYVALKRIAEDIQARVGVGGPNEGPWATAFWSVVLTMAVGYGLTLWSVSRYVPADEPVPPPTALLIARRLRIVALIPLAMLLAFIAYALWVGNPQGSGFRIYGAFSLTSLWSAAFIAWRHGPTVLPYPLRRIFR